MDKLRTGSSWFRLSVALLIATPLALLGTQQIPLVAPTKVEAAGCFGTIWRSKKSRTMRKQRVAVTQ